ncbi:MAG: translesion DNA synthesis-associated protein ImuA [Polaromonas sp.]|nr:translesion DNA synthesis-associated protein ImuA [Polaromonas sp.]
MFSPAPDDRPDTVRADLADSLANTAVWRAGELGSASQQTCPTSYAALDSVLPGSGWPQGALIEILQPQAGLHEWGLVAPALAAAQKASPSRMTVLVGAPSLPFGPALGARLISMPHLLCVKTRPGAAPALLWATREALQCADVGAVLAWLPDARSAHLRRLQIAAHAHDKLLFVFRPMRAQSESSPAPLRLLLEGDSNPAADGKLRVHILKRRGPPLDMPVLLDTRHERLAALLAAQRERTRRQREEAGGFSYPLPSPRPAIPAESPVHALLDRLVQPHLH